MILLIVCLIVEGVVIWYFYNYFKKRAVAKKLITEYNENDKYSCLKNANVGDIIKLGEYKPQDVVQPIEWIVVRKINGRITLISKNILAEYRYDNGGSHVDWMGCDLRQYMNSKEFLEEFFSLEERLIPSNNSCVKGNGDAMLSPNTKDTFYVLSRDEIEKYMDIPAFNDSCLNKGKYNFCNAFWVRSKEPNKYMIYSIKENRFIEQETGEDVFGIRAVFKICTDDIEISRLMEKRY